ncbi:hypothetical protein [Sphingomonas sp.]|uniref:hypothetical protein n=1 Tax=Sphingomonas sp. TaxID=28214 RepID=UPI0017E6AD19|nr:hypothetical protein [Sphingomonas sp.]MBA3510413.1 hypothetical protein [Sphingomonas sp.]
MFVGRTTLEGFVVKSTDKKHASELELANAELRQSLEHCRELLAECRAKLAANSNIAFAQADPEDQAREA